jgi:hypothetical protein
MATPEEINRELSNLARSLGSASADIASASKTAATGANAVKLSLQTFATTLKSTASSISDINSDFQKFDGAITATSNSIQRFSVFFGKYGIAFKGVIKGFEASLKSVTQFGESLTQFYDSVSALGVTASRTTDQILDLMHQAGYTLANSKEFYKLVKDSGTTLTSLGETSAKGLDRLASVFNVTQLEGAQESFLKLGLGPKELNKLQLEYIKSQATVGLKLTSNDNLLRESSLEYAKSLTKLSALTGESRDKVAQEIAKNRKDIRYALKIQELTAKGNQKAIDAFDKAGAIVGLNLGDDYSSGLRDFVANGTATTKEGEMLLYKTQGQIAKWVRDVEAGTMDEVELARKIAKAEQQFTQGNREALTFSDEFRERMSSSGDTIAGATRLLEIRSKEDVDKMVEAAAKREDARKSNQSETINLERKASHLNDKLSQMLFGTGVDVILGLIEIVKQTARGTIKLALMLPIDGKLEESLKELETILSSKDGLGETKKELDGKIDEISKQIKDRENIAKSIKLSESELKEAQERKTKLDADVQKDPTSDLAKETQRNNEILIERKQREIEILKRKEKELEEKRTKQELERDRKKLLDQSRRVEKERKQTTKADQTVPPVRTDKKDDGKRRPYKPPKMESGEDDDRTIYPELAPVKGKFSNIDYVDARFQKQFQGLIDEMEERGYKVKTLSGYRKHNTVRGGPYSAHAFGIAIDVNAKENWGNMDTGGEGPVKTDMPAYFSQLAKKYGLGWGKDWGGKWKDPMHFSGMPKEGGSLVKGTKHIYPQFKRGGVGQGPESGYDVTLHGREAIVPFNGKPIQVKINDKNLKIDHKKKFNELAERANEMRQKLQEKTNKVDLKAKDTTVDFTEITNNIKAKIVNLNQFYQENQEDTVDTSLADALVNKLENMISSVDRSNSIHNDLKMYLRN